MTSRPVPAGFTADPDVLHRRAYFAEHGTPPGALDWLDDTEPLDKFNPHHDAEGRFSSEGASGTGELGSQSGNPSPSVGPGYAASPTGGGAAKPGINPKDAATWPLKLYEKVTVKNSSNPKINDMPGGFFAGFYSDGTAKVVFHGKKDKLLGIFGSHPIDLDCLSSIEPGGFQGKHVLAGTTGVAGAPMHKPPAKGSPTPPVQAPTPAPTPTTGAFGFRTGDAVTVHASASPHHGKAGTITSFDHTGNWVNVKLASGYQAILPTKSLHIKALAPATPPAPATATPAPAAEMPKTLSDLKALTPVAGPHGSQPGQWYQAPDGTKYYAKPSPSPERAYNELSADVVYELAGATVPAVTVIKDTSGSGHTIVSQFVPGYEQKSLAWWQSPAAEAARKDAYAHWGTDVLLQHYDTVGLDTDNMLVDPATSKVLRVEGGAAMGYRAMGQPKKGWTAATDQVQQVSADVTSMLGGPPFSNPQLKAVFGDMSKDTAATLLQVAALALSKHIDSGALQSAWQSLGVPNGQIQANLHVLENKLAAIPLVVSGLTGTSITLSPPTNQTPPSPAAAPNAFSTGEPVAWTDALGNPHAGTYTGPTQDPTVHEVATAGGGTAFIGQADLWHSGSPAAGAHGGATAEHGPLVHITAPNVPEWHDKTAEYMGDDAHGNAIVDAHDGSEPGYFKHSALSVPSGPGSWSADFHGNQYVSVAGAPDAAPAAAAPSSGIKAFKNGDPVHVTDPASGKVTNADYLNPTVAGDPDTHVVALPGTDGLYATHIDNIAAGWVPSASNATPAPPAPTAPRTKKPKTVIATKPIVATVQATDAHGKHKPGKMVDLQFGASVTWTDPYTPDKNKYGLLVGQSKTKDGYVQVLLPTGKSIVVPLSQIKGTSHPYSAKSKLWSAIKNPYHLYNSQWVQVGPSQPGNPNSPISGVKGTIQDLDTDTGHVTIETTDGDTLTYHLAHIYPSAPSSPGFVPTPPKPVAPAAPTPPPDTAANAVAMHFTKHNKQVANGWGIDNKDGTWTIDYLGASGSPYHITAKESDSQITAGHVPTAYNAPATANPSLSAAGNAISYGGQTVTLPDPPSPDVLGLAPPVIGPIVATRKTATPAQWTQACANASKLWAVPNHTGGWTCSTSTESVKKGAADALWTNHPDLVDTYGAAYDASNSTSWGRPKFGGKEWSQLSQAQQKQSFGELAMHQANTWNGSSTGDVAFQLAVQKEFALPDATVSAKTNLSISPGVQAKYKQFGAAYRIVARSIYEHTQQRLKDMGVAEVAVVRRMSTGHAYGTGDQPITLRPLNSYARGDHPYGGQSGEHYYAIVPAAQVFSSAMSGPGTISENEIVIVGGVNLPMTIT